MRKIKINYSDFKKAVREVSECDSGWNIYIDLNDGEIGCKHNSSCGESWLMLINGCNVDADTDTSDENIDGVFGIEHIEDAVEEATCGVVEVEVEQ